MPTRPTIHPIPDGNPCDTIKARDRAGEDAWTEISQEHADYFLNVLPPIWVSGGFQVSEPWTDTSMLPTWKERPQGVLFLTIAQSCGQHYARHMTTPEAPAEIRRLRATLQQRALT